MKKRDEGMRNMEKMKERGRFKSKKRKKRKKMKDEIEIRNAIRKYTEWMTGKLKKGKMIQLNLARYCNTQ